MRNLFFVVLKTSLRHCYWRIHLLTIMEATMQTVENITNDQASLSPVIIIRRAEVERLTGLTSPHIYQLMRKGKFPKQVKLGERAVGWIKAEVVQWVADCVRMRRLPRRLSIVRR